ncbi:MAG: hypothetical protein HDT44_04440 [Ruminococcaceae bacterium]|nr:hypothetical protein [Oscillospiraceae bacterium]
MTTLQDLQNEYGKIDCRDLGSRRLEQLRDGLKKVMPTEIVSTEGGKMYIELLRKFREAVAENDKLHGDNYPQLLNSLLSVGEDGLYSNNLRFIFELIQNVDDCDYKDAADCKLDMRFDFENDEIVLTYNEVGFTPFNVFAITGIAEAAKNISSEKNQIGEKGIGFKSVFGVADRVWIKSGWFSFELYKDNFTIPISAYSAFNYYSGTQMILYVPGKAKQIYKEIKNQYCKKDALFSRNPLLFLNKLTSLKIYFDGFRNMKFHVMRTDDKNYNPFKVENNVEISVDLNDYENGSEFKEKREIRCTRYTYHVVFSKMACCARYGENTKVGQENGKIMILSAVVPDAEFLSEIGKGALYSFLPTQLKLTVPIVFHAPFKLDASREFVDPQDNNLWFQEASQYLSELMDRVYLDYCKKAKEDILKYLPGKKESLFANNNGKEKCLTNQDFFNGAHYLDLPILYTIDGEYKNANEVFCFNEKEKITEPDKVCRLMEYSLSLFNATIINNKFEIEIKKNVKDEMFRKALASADKTGDILDYLDSVSYVYTEDLISQIASIKISLEQAYIILKHSKLTDLLRKICCDEIKKNKRFKLEIADVSGKIITDVLGDNIELNDAPEKVRKYMEYCNKKCICIDESNGVFLPCYNAILISEKEPLLSFISFCSDIDSNNLFTMRMKWREQSKKLNESVDDLTIPEKNYMQMLRDIRLVIHEILGKEGYCRLLDIIQKSGTGKGRFIQELIQNADDCNYAPNVTPSFLLSVKNQTITTEYNEMGFTRANIRSITAIGESTKKRLLSETSTTIGEKGVGFKSIFAVASKVTIHSGDYHFSLSAEKPTIPDLCEGEQKNVSGTRMEIQLKNNELALDYKEKDILELCLCLRNLKKLTIGKHTVTICDTEGKRTINIGKNEYVFKRFCHNFTITNDAALEERKEGYKEISTEQQLTCYVPIEGTQSDFPLYCGLPTRHKIKIPMVIDAPFSLTTSREEIETEGSKWNEIIRAEVYSLILKVIESLKKEERDKILRFIKIGQVPSKGEPLYYNDTFDLSYLNKYDFLSLLRLKKIIPTFNQDIFAVPNERTARRYPSVVTYILNHLPSSEYNEIDTSSIVDADNNQYSSVLNALYCSEVSFSYIFSFVFKYSERFVQNEDFRKDLYEYICKKLTEVPNEYREQIKELKIIPVYGTEYDTTIYTSWEENNIFVKPNALRSDGDYYVLNEKLMSKSLCEDIYAVNINEMNSEWEHDRYNKKLIEKICNEDDMPSVYNFLLSEYDSGRLKNNDSFRVLSTYMNKIPLKNQCDNIVACRNLFVCDVPNYFNTEMIKRITVHNECTELAKCIGLANDVGIKSLRNIHYEDIQFYEELTEDDIEVLTDENDGHYFYNYVEILRRFYYDDLISDELLKKYEIEYVKFHSYEISDYSDDFDFPSEPIGNREMLADHIKNLCSAPPEIITVTEERSVQKIENSDGEQYSIDSKKVRDITMNRYSPEGENDKCFCQMCQNWEYKTYIEVNNIEKSPDFFFEQLRIALCLKCSKYFETLRDKKSIIEAFLTKIKECDINDEYDEPIKISIGEGEETISFTPKHLAEIQEILKQRPKSKKQK